MKNNRITSEDNLLLLKNDIESSSDLKYKTELDLGETKLDNRFYELKNIRKMKFLKRNFGRKMGEGSLRGSIITLLRMTLGVGIFAIPYYTKSVGLIPSILMLLICSLISYFSFDIISTAAHCSGASSYQECIKLLLGKKIHNLSKITFTIDFTAAVFIYQIVSWNLFQYIAYITGIFKEEWLLDKKTLKFDQWNLNVFYYRIGYFAVVYMLLFVNLLKDNLENLRIFSSIFIFVLILLILYIFGQMPFYRIHYNQENKIIFHLFKPFSHYWITTFFSLLSSFSCQIFIVKVRSELFLPTQRRIRKVIKSTMIIEFIIFSLIASICYYSLGDSFTPQLIILRKSLDVNGISEYIMTGLLILFLMSSIMSLAIFNIPFKRYWMYLIHQKYEVSKNLHLFYSTVPFLCVSLLAIFCCDITYVFTILSLTVWNFDGYFYTVLLKIRLLRPNDRLRPLKIFLLIFFLVVFFFGCGLGVYYKL